MFLGNRRSSTFPVGQAIHGDVVDVPAGLTADCRLSRVALRAARSALNRRIRSVWTWTDVDVPGERVALTAVRLH